jgi:hypothetical protein
LKYAGSNYYKAYGRKSKGNTGALLKIAAVIFCILVVFLFAGIMTGGFFIDLAEKNGIRCGAREYYILSFGSFEDKAGAERAAVSLRARGGGGYVRKEGTYKVYAALYLSRTDAESVRGRLGGAGFECSVVKLTAPAYRFTGGVTKANEKGLTEALETFGFAVGSLYSVFADLDGGIINDLDAERRVAGVREEAARRSAVLDGLGVSGHQAARLKAELIALQISVSMITEGYYLTENFSAEIKYCLLKIAHDYAAFCKDMQ